MTLELMKMSKKKRRENNSKWSAAKPISKLKRRSACDVKVTPGLRLDTRVGGIFIIYQ